MSWARRTRNAFTLVELLVVIGIIAILIAILMPALSRARKQALQASCGSNERQVTYAALAYANDWKESLPTRLGCVASCSGCTPWDLHFICRLPIVGFDTGTIWDWGTYIAAPFNDRCLALLGGWAFMLRDYLKNDFDIYVCPDGFYTRAQMVTKWSGAVTSLGPLNPADWDLGQGLLADRSGYLWLAQRQAPLTGPPPGTALTNLASQCSSVSITDKPGDIAKTASAKAELLVMADFNQFSTILRGDVCGSADRSVCGIVGANHPGTEYRQLIPLSRCLPRVFVPNIGREENPEQMPLGMNRARIDARVTWLPWQDWDYYRYPVHPEIWYSF